MFLSGWINWGGKIWIFKNWWKNHKCREKLKYGIFCKYRKKFKYQKILKYRIFSKSRRKFLAGEVSWQNVGNDPKRILKSCCEKFWKFLQVPGTPFVASGSSNFENFTSPWNSVCCKWQSNFRKKLQVPGTPNVASGYGNFRKFF